MVRNEVRVLNPFLESPKVVALGEHRQGRNLQFIELALQTGEATAPSRTVLLAPSIDPIHQLRAEPGELRRTFNIALQLDPTGNLGEEDHKLS